MNKKGNLIPELLISMILVVVTSAVIFFLVQQGIIQVKAENSQEQILNAEFLPYGKEGSVVVKDFKLCSFVDTNYNCLAEKENFDFGEEVHLVFLAESSTYNGQIMLLENYRIKSPSGTVLIDVDQKKSFNFELSSAKDKELVAFKDYFIINPGQESGEYTLELVVENPLLEKKATLSKFFMINNPSETDESAIQYEE